MENKEDAFENHCNDCRQERELDVEQVEDDGMTTGKIFTDMTVTPADPPTKRSMCGRCGRPSKVCLCPHFPQQQLDITTCVYIIQHPNEANRSLRTVPILFNCLQQGKCCLIRGRRFSEIRKIHEVPNHQNFVSEAVQSCLSSWSCHPELAAVCKKPHTLVLFPGPEAIDITQVPPLPSASQSVYNLIVIDGTWNQAKSMYKSNEIFHQAKQVQLSNGNLSEYVIRTQPTNSSLSTVESVALSLAIIEKRPEIQETLLCPLRALCQFQLDHGAAIHHSKEHLRDNGLVYPHKRPECS